jgi:hypothetical protein
MIVLVKKAIFIIVDILVLGIVLFLPSQPAYASCPDGFVEDSATGKCVKDTSSSGGSGGSGATTHDNCSASDVNFLYFPTWYRGLECDADGNINIGQGTDLSTTIFKIALNIIDIALRIAGILAVGFVIWGGFQYVLARGEPEKAKQALDTILKAVIGAVIAMIAAMVVSFVVWRLSL